MTTDVNLPRREPALLFVQDAQAVDSLFTQLGSSSSSEDLPATGTSPRIKATPQSRPSMWQVERASQVRGARSARIAPDSNAGGWVDDLRLLSTVAAIVFALAIAAKAVRLSLDGASAVGRPAQAAVIAPAASTPRFEKVFKAKPIQDCQVGERIPGRNPLREQVDLFEPAEADWLKISLRMRQQNGLWLWIDLLRPTEWGQANEVGAGRTIYLDLPEMGAVGDAQVMGIGPCPPIDQGPGTVITGTFKRESDGSHVVELRLEGQEEPTGVTDNHPYWSVDRQKFVEVGNLRVGELVDTEFGSRHIESVRPCFYREFLYNLETSEHVFRVGSLGALVHNSCVLTRYADDGGHHIFAKRAFEGLPGYNADDALAIGQQELARLGLPHLDPGGITASQRRLFGELAASGRANTLAEHARIALEALLENGMKSRDAADVVRRAESQLRSWGITTPLRIPWN